MASDRENATDLQKKKNKEGRFRWSEEDKVPNLIECLANYKSTMEFNNIDFAADKVKMYEAVRQAMSRIYIDQPSHFGPVRITIVESTDEVSLEDKSKIENQQKVDRELIKRGYTRIQEKLKEIRQNFSKAVTTGTRSGSGKIVLEFYDQLAAIWGGSPATEPLSCGVNTDETNSLVVQELSSEEDSTDSNSIRKRKSTENPTPKLIDNKRKHLERQLSAAQRDQLLINEAKEESQFKKDLAEAIRQPNIAFSESMQQMSMSILQVAQGLTRSIEIMGQALLNQSPVNTPHQHSHEVTYQPPHSTLTSPSPSYSPSFQHGHTTRPSQNMNVFRNSTEDSSEPHLEQL